MPDFDFSTLITDRSQADVDNLRSLLSTPLSAWTAEQLAAFNQAISKGAYNYTDLNRVTACMDYLNEQLRGYGYQTGYSRITIPHKAVSALPDGYTELEYIESSGTQYIDTGFKPNNNTRAVADFEFTATNTWRAVFAARDANSANSFSLEYIGGAFRSDYGSDTSQQFPMEALGRRIYDKNKETTTIDGTSQSYANTPFQCGHNLCLWALNDNGEIKWLASGKLYSCQIYDNGTLVRNYIPCRSPDGEVGLYDRIGSQFYGNAGSGTFTAGPEVEAPDGPEEELDPYTWYESDVPTASLMAAYLANVEALRSTLEVLSTTPETPESMAALAWAEANDIERILIDINTMVTALGKVFLRAGMPWAWAGNEIYVRNEVSG